MKKFGILGIDIGTVGIKTAFYTQEEGFTRPLYYRMRSTLSEDFITAIQQFITEAGVEPAQIALTGRGAQMIAQTLGISLVNEIFAHAAATSLLQPEAKSVIDIGGHDAAYIEFSEQSSKQEVQIKEYRTNSRCAAGTGSFLDQQAVRLGIDIETEFAKKALSAQNVPRIAGRCSVFAKSDMIHLQQIATPDDEIVAGLCLAMAESFKSDIMRGHKPRVPVAVQGGVSQNKAMVHFLRTVFELDEQSLLVPEQAEFAGAIGAVLRAKQEGKLFAFTSVSELKEGLTHETGAITESELGALSSAEESYIQGSLKQDGFVKECFLGIDIGSISTNLVLMSLDGDIVAKRYLMTAGRPIEAVKKGLQELESELGEKVSILGCGTTGSARYLIGDLFGADIIKNEITAQARGAVFLYPEVDTIFEIGGQDSKYISLEQGTVTDFTMNKACAAGTGSFLEEQAGLMGISVKEQFAKLAFQAQAPSPLGQRCTVFIESDLVQKLKGGESLSNLCAGLSYSIVLNYLNRVVEHRKIGNSILFQGGTAFNQAVTAAFRGVTGKDVKVPPHNEVTGAIGMAEIVRQQYLEKEFTTAFKGFSCKELSYDIKTFVCNGCANSCEVKQVSTQHGEPLFYGHRCEKFERKKRAHIIEQFDFFQQRDAIFKEFINKDLVEHPRGTIGIPVALSFHETLPFWSTFFNHLGYEVVLSEPTNRALIKKGVARVTAENCFPIKVFYGHINSLLEKKPDHIFIPSVINMPLDGSSSEHNFNCTMVQSAPFLAKSVFRDEQFSLLAPVIHWQYGLKSILKELDPMRAQLGLSKRQLAQAFQMAERAQAEYEQHVFTAAEQFLASHGEERVVVIMSRPYNGYDPGLNLAIPRKLAELGVASIPFETLPIFSGTGAEHPWRDMFWRYGQRILAGLNAIREESQYLPVMISNFNCGPDSFILHYAAETMGGKPILFLEVDEHSADAGIVTRLEAFLDSVGSASNAEPQKMAQAKRKPIDSFKGKKVYVPNMNDSAVPVAAAFRREGVDAEVLPEPDRENIELGRSRTSGKECYPMTITTGDLFKISRRSDFAPGKTVFFMPTTNGPCRFGEYSRLQQMFLEKDGVVGLEIFSPSSGDGYDALRDFSSSFYFNIWKGMVCVDILLKALMAVRPYELEAGSAEAVYDSSIKELEHILEHSPGQLTPFMLKCRQRFDSIARRTEKRVRIAVVGEIYVRCNRFANNDVIRRLEKLGAEVVLAPFCEWSFYANFLSIENKRRQGKYLSSFVDSVKNFFQKHAEHRFMKPFAGFGLFEEPDVKDVVARAEMFLDSNVRGEALLTLGKAADFVEKGFDGIVNLMPFSCMPGLIVSSLVPAFREKYSDVPWLNLAFEDSESELEMMPLEAFIEQARTYNRIKQKGAATV